MMLESKLFRSFFSCSCPKEMYKNRLVTFLFYKCNYAHPYIQNSAKHWENVFSPPKSSYSRQPLTFNPFGYRRELNCKINDNSAVLLAESLLQQFKCACEHTSNGNSDDLRPFKGNIILNRIIRSFASSSSRSERFHIRFVNGIYL